jgi:hypothetical protein
VPTKSGHFHSAHFIDFIAVFADLSSLSRQNQQPESAAAKEALKSVQSAYTKYNKDVRILTTSGEDITKKHLAPETSSPPTCTTPVGDAETQDEKEENLIGVTRRATNLKDFDTPQESMDHARSAILLTADRVTRVRAARDRVAALAPDMIRKLFFTTGLKRSPSQTSKKSDQPSFGGNVDPDQMEIS